MKFSFLGLKTKKISTKITVTFVGLFLVVLLTSGFFLNRLMRASEVERFYEDIQNINLLKAENVTTFLMSEKEVARMLGASTIFRDFLKLASTSPSYATEKARTTQQLFRSIAQVDQIQELFILNSHGVIVASTDETKVGLDRSQDDYFLNGKKDTYVKDFYYSDVTQRNAYAVSSPIKDDVTDELLGIVVLRMKPDNLYNILSLSSSVDATEESFLVNRDGYLISTTRYLGPDQILKKKIETKNVKDCFTQKGNAVLQENDYSLSAEPSNYIDYRGVPNIGTHAFLQASGWCLITKIDSNEVVKASTQITITFLITGFLSAFLFFFVGFNLSRKITDPLKSLKEGAEKIGVGNLDYKVGTAENDEVGDLSRTFDKMTEAIKKSRAEISERVKEQTEEISRTSEEIREQQKATLNILEDIEKEKERSEMLAKDLEKFKLAVENASDHIVITNPEGTIIYANKGMARITGFSQEEVIGQKVGSKQNWGGLMDKSTYENLWDTIKIRKKTFIGGLENRRKNGEKYEVIASVSPVLDSNGEVLFFVGTERDITKERAVDRAKTEFVSLASHQLRTPLSAINWYCEMLLGGDVGTINDGQKKYLQEIYAGNKRMVDLVNSLLNVSRLELGTFIVEPTSTDAVEISKNVIHEIEKDIADKKLTLEQNYADDIPKDFPADQKLLRMVFQNLLSNAVKYTPESGKINVSIRNVKAKEVFGGKEMPENVLGISVSDTGIGIPERQKDQIFSRFFRTDKSKETQAEGTGLGLYIIKQIADQSGGQIWFESAENIGTTFFVAFPITGMKKKAGTKKLD